MKRAMITICVGFMVVLFAANMSWASTVYLVNYDHGSQSPGPDPYTAGTGEILPTGVTGTLLANTNLVDSAAGAPQGGQAQSQTLGGLWSNQQGYHFNGNAPLIQNNYTLEFLVKPDFSGCQFGLTDTSYIIDSSDLGDSTQVGDMNLSVDQNTGIVSFRPKNGSGYGVITSTTTLVSGQWYHIAAVIRGSGDANQRTELWIDGVLDGTGSYPTSWETQGQYRFDDFNIGSWYWSVQRNWQGEIDAFAISDAALDGGSFVIPEPATIGLLVLGFGFLVRRRK